MLKRRQQLVPLKPLCGTSQDSQFATDLFGPPLDQKCDKLSPDVSPSSSYHSDTPANEVNTHTHTHTHTHNGLFNFDDVFLISASVEQD